MLLWGRFNWNCPNDALSPDASLWFQTWSGESAVPRALCQTGTGLGGAVLGWRAGSWKDFINDLL